MSGQIALLYSKQKTKHETIHWKHYYDENPVKNVGGLNESYWKVNFKKTMQSWSKMAYDEVRAVLTYTTKLGDIMERINTIDGESNGTKIFPR